MKKILGIFLTLVALYAITAALGTGFLSAYNQEQLLERTALYGILGVGVAFVIITGGIDLSIGSVVCLTGCGLPWLLVKHNCPPWLALLAVVVVSVLIGLSHGLLITKLKLQPFVVTLCGLLIYRGITRGFTADQSQGFEGGFEGLRSVATEKISLGGSFGIPWTWMILLLVAVLSWIFLNKTIYGRYLRALGNNEEAARFSGINTDRMVILAYVVCSLLAGLGGVLFVADVGSAQSSDFGNFYELYAIAAAVLGGCSLRGGEGTVIGVVIGAAVMQVLKNMINLVTWIPTHIEFAVVGAVILVAVVADELVKRAVARRRARG
ncbi:MAG: ABC transporter permease [Verrucomicrobia bacterium]|nr:ABC transporter permease [Verrucomicrobiota bacterium]MDA1007110.1 ABC transporter permease [Verrucomicrobiota bacterium]